MLPSLFLFIPLFIMPCECVGMYRCRFMSLSAHRGQRRVSTVLFYHPLIPTRLGLFLNPGLGWQPASPSNPRISAPNITAITGVRVATPDFLLIHGYQGFKLRSSYLHNKHYPPPSQVLCPGCLLLQKKEPAPNCPDGYRKPMQSVLGSCSESKLTSSWGLGRG